MIGLHFLALVMFLVFARFRAPLEALLIPLAGCGVIELVRRGRERRWVAVTLQAAIVALLMMLTLRGATFRLERLTTYDDYIAGYQSYDLPRYFDAEARHDWSRALRVIDDALKIEPPRLRTIAAANGGNPDAVSRSLLYFYGLTHNLRGDVLDSLGMGDEASREHALWKRYEAASGEPGG